MAAAVMRSRIHEHACVAGPAQPSVGVCTSHVIQQGVRKPVVGITTSTEREKERMAELLSRQRVMCGTYTPPFRHVTSM